MILFLQILAVIVLVAAIPAFFVWGGLMALNINRVWPFLVGLAVDVVATTVALWAILAWWVLPAFT